MSEASTESFSDIITDLLPILKLEGLTRLAALLALFIFIGLIGLAAAIPLIDWTDYVNIQISYSNPQTFNDAFLKALSTQLPIITLTLIVLACALVGTTLVIRGLLDLRGEWSLAPILSASFLVTLVNCFFAYSLGVISLFGLGSMALFIILIPLIGVFFGVRRLPSNADWIVSCFSAAGTIVVLILDWIYSTLTQSPVKLALAESLFTAFLVYAFLGVTVCYLLAGLYTFSFAIDLGNTFGKLLRKIPYMPYIVAKILRALVIIILGLGIFILTVVRFVLWVIGLLVPVPEDIATLSIVVMIILVGWGLFKYTMGFIEEESDVFPVTTRTWGSFGISYLVVSAIFIIATAVIADQVLAAQFTGVGAADILSSYTTFVKDLFDNWRNLAYFIGFLFSIPILIRSIWNWRKKQLALQKETSNE
ncbi:MAG: hypothetical protein ACFFDI_01495 [Promethearchaeota archaeon]